MRLSRAQLLGSVAVLAALWLVVLFRLFFGATP